MTAVQASTAEGLPLTPFVPCVEDADFTREVGRHPVAFQRTLDAASYHFLLATSRLARDPTLHTEFQLSVTTHYTRLWRQRVAVPKPIRREWFETVMVHLHALGTPEVGLLWLMDHPSAHAEATPTATAVAPSEAAVTVATVSPERKASKAKKAAVDSIPLWCLWQDTQRHLHHLSLRLSAWTPSMGGAHATREAVRPSDLTRMDSSAFMWRVRLWSRVSCVVLSHPSVPLRIGHPAESGDLASLLTGTALVPFTDAEPELAQLLTTLGSPVSCGVCEMECAARRRVAGALLYRMLLETAVVRLRVLPRCMFAWRLLRDTLQSVAACATTPASTAGALTAIAAYVEVILLPYLEQRDCHLGNMRHTASSIQAHFTRLSTQRIKALHASVVAAAVDGDGVAGSSGSPAVSDSDSPLSMQERLAMGAAMCTVLRYVCQRDASPIPQSGLGAYSAILSTADDDDEMHGVASPSLEAVTAVVREVHHRQLELRLFFSETARTLQLTVFLFHYFTQAPTLAFDRVSRGAVTDASSAVVEECAG